MPARFRVRVRLWAPNRRGALAEGMTSLVVCALHQRTVNLMELMSDEGWEQIASGFEALGKVRPDRRLTEWYFEPLPDAPG